MSDRETSLRIYLALLARDPLAQQRFTVIGERFELLAHLACSAAEQFDAVRAEWDRNPMRAAEAAAKHWDMRSAPKPDDLKLKNKITIAEGSPLPKAEQGDLLGERRDEPR